MDTKTDSNVRTVSFILGNSFWILLPFYGSVLFAGLYLIATLYYPGGSQADISSKGFSWVNNYWCNLLSEKAMNGQINGAKPIAITALFVLCITLATFWFIFPRYSNFKRNRRILFQISGILSMLIAMFLFTNFHDIIVDIASLFGFIAMVGTFIGLNKLKWKKLFWLGMFNLILIGINNILYYVEGLIDYLPVVQKITFFFVLLWICLISINLYGLHVKRRQVIEITD